MRERLYVHALACYQDKFPRPPPMVAYIITPGVPLRELAAANSGD